MHLPPAKERDLALTISGLRAPSEWTKVRLGTLPDRRLNAIVALCAQHFKVPVAAIRGRSRRPKLVRIRFVVYYLVWQSGPYSLNEIARRFDRDRTSIRNGIFAMAGMIEQDAKLMAVIEKLAVDPLCSGIAGKPACQAPIWLAE